MALLGIKTTQSCQRVAYFRCSPLQCCSWNVTAPSSSAIGFLVNCQNLKKSLVEKHLNILLMYIILQQIKCMLVTLKYEDYYEKSK